MATWVHIFHIVSRLKYKHLFSESSRKSECSALKNKVPNKTYYFSSAKIDISLAASERMFHNYRPNL